MYLLSTAMKYIPGVFSEYKSQMMLKTGYMRFNIQS